MRPKRKQVDPRPVMPTGETEFEEKRIACEFELTFKASEFELTFKAIAELGLSSIKETHEYAFRSGYVSGKVAAIHQDGQAKPFRLPSYIKIL